MLIAVVVDELQDTRLGIKVRDEVAVHGKSLRPEAADVRVLELLILQCVVDVRLWLAEIDLAELYPTELDLLPAVPPVETEFFLVCPPVEVITCDALRWDHLWRAVLFLRKLVFLSLRFLNALGLDVHEFRTQFSILARYGHRYPGGIQKRLDRTW